MNSKVIMVGLCLWSLTYITFTAAPLTEYYAFIDLISKGRQPEIPRSPSSMHRVRPEPPRERLKIALAIRALVLTTMNSELNIYTVFFL